MGGGCYGTFYASQLAKAKTRGKVDFRSVIVVDRDLDCRARRELGEAADRRFVTQDWTAFFDGFFTDAVDDHVVPSPHMPHLMFEWVLVRARRRWPGRSVTVGPVPGTLGTPYDRTAPTPDATRYVSFADWICPTHCIEPGEGRPVAGPALFVCRHHVFGVGTFAVDAVLAGDRLVAEAGASGAPAEVLVGTISSCHGALNLLQLGAQ